MSESVNPNDLVAAVAKPRLTVAMIISFVIHVALLLLLSIGFLQQCIQYKTVHPKTAIKLEKKLAAEAAEQKRKDDALKNAQLKAKEEKEAAEKAEKAVKPVEDAKKSLQKKAVEKLENQKLDPASAKGSVEEGLVL